MLGTHRFYPGHYRLHHLSVLNPASALLFRDPCLLSYGMIWVIFYLVREGTTDEDDSIQLHSSEHIFPRISHSSISSIYAKGDLEQPHLPHQLCPAY